MNNGGVGSRTQVSDILQQHPSTCVVDFQFSRLIQIDKWSREYVAWSYYTFCNISCVGVLMSYIPYPSSGGIGTCFTANYAARARRVLVPVKFFDRFLRVSINSTRQTSLRNLIEAKAPPKDQLTP